MDLSSTIKSLKNNALEDVLHAAQAQPGLLGEVDEAGMTLLDHAVEAGNCPAAQLLLRLGADPNRRPGPDEGEGPLMRALLNKDTPMARTLLCNGADINQRDHYDYAPIQRAIMSQDADMVALLLEHGVELHFDTGPREGLVESALSYATDAIVVKLMRAGALFKPQPRQLRELLTRAIERRMLHATQALVDAGGCVRQLSHKQHGAVREACEAGALSIALFLVAQGADPHEAPSDYDWIGWAGSDEVRQWRASLQQNATLETTTAPVGAVLQRSRL